MASHKLKKLQTIRRIEREDAAEQLFDQTVAAELNNINFAEQSQKPAFDGKSEIRSSKHVLSNVEGSETSGAYGENFAEQSQFAPSLMGSTSFMERRYDDTAHPETAGNKANLTSQYPPGRAKIERSERLCADERMIGSTTSP